MKYPIILFISSASKFGNKGIWILQKKNEESSSGSQRKLQSADLKKDPVPIKLRLHQLLEWFETWLRLI